MLEEKSRSDTEGSLNESWFYKNLWGLDGSDLMGSKELLVSKSQLKARDTDEGSSFGIKGSFLELTFICTLMSKGVLLSIAPRVCGIPSNN